jgi:hypothetical protein
MVRFGQSGGSQTLGSLCVAGDRRHPEIQAQIHPNRRRTLSSGRAIGSIAHPWTIGPYVAQQNVSRRDQLSRQVYLGKHKPITDEKLFKALQAKLAENLKTRRLRRQSPDASLAGKLFDDQGNPRATCAVGRGAIGTMFLAPPAEVEKTLPDRWRGSPRKPRRLDQRLQRPSPRRRFGIEQGRRRQRERQTESNGQSHIVVALSSLRLCGCSCFLRRGWKSKSVAENLNDGSLPKVHPDRGPLRANTAPTGVSRARP